MRILAIGDMHGCSKALDTLLAVVAPQPEYALFWDGFNSSKPHISGKIMVCGHLSQKSGNPVHLGHAICLDTWACGEG